MSKQFPYTISLAFLFSIIFLFMLVAFLIDQSSTAPAYAVAATSDSLHAQLIVDSDDTIANCRYGTAPVYADSYLQSQAIPQLGAGWFLNFGPKWTNPFPANGAEFVHLIKTHQQKTADGTYLDDYYTNIELDNALATYIRENPGDLWIIGNEVDRGPNPGDIVGGQGDMYPEIYAQAYYEVRAFIKRHDPTARTAISALVEVTPGRLQYLSKVWKAYRDKYGHSMPVDVWNMHIYVLPELEADGITPNGIANIALGTDPALGKRGSGNNTMACDDPDVYCYAEHDDLAVFGEQVLAMRQWMKEHGQQQKPLILSEYSILYPYIDDGDTCYLQDEYGGCFTPERVATFMSYTFDYLNQLRNENLGYTMDQDRLVQQWLWFALHTPSVGSASNLLAADKQTLTKVGKTFQQAVYSEQIAANFVVDNIPNMVAVIDQSGRATVPIQVNFRNNGNMAVEEPFTVTFYEDHIREKEIGSVLISELVRGCTTNVYKASIEWPELTAGQYRFWVTIDSGNVIDESPPNQEDNQGSGWVIVKAKSSFIPLISR